MKVLSQILALALWASSCVSPVESFVPGTRQDDVEIIGAFLADAVVNSPIGEEEGSILVLHCRSIGGRFAASYATQRDFIGIPLHEAAVDIEQREEGSLASMEFDEVSVMDIGSVLRSHPPDRAIAWKTIQEAIPGAKCFAAVTLPGYGHDMALCGIFLGPDRENIWGVAWFARKDGRWVLQDSRYHRPIS